jgi:hypothetical protein
MSVQRRHIIASVAILVIFAVGLVGFFLVSNGLPDGLDRTMEQHGAPESDPVYKAPLTYGNDYLSMLVMGAVGFIITLLAVLGVVRLRKKKARSQEEK